MISQRYFVLILLTLCLREASADLPQLDFARASAAVVAITAGFVLFAKLVAYQMVRRSLFESRTSVGNTAERFRDARLWIERVWCVALPMTMLATGWFAWTRQFHESGWPECVLLGICFAPTALFLIFVEITSAQLDSVGCRRRANGISSRVLLNVDTTNIPIGPLVREKCWIEQWLLRVRLGDMAGLLTCLVPVLLVAGISDAGRMAHQRFGITPTWVELPAAALSIGAFVAVFPLLLTRWSAGQTLPGPLRRRFRAMASQVGIRGTPPVLIPSHGRWCGAAVVGWFPGLRRLWLGDAVIQVLSPRQLDMVVLHELAHIQRRHYIWRALPIVLALVLGGGLWAVGIQWQVSDWLPFKLSVGAISGMVLVWSLGRMARACELDADRVACRLAEKSVLWSQDFSPASELGSALATLIGGAPADQKTTWLHPSLCQRLEALGVSGRV